MPRTARAHRQWTTRLALAATIGTVALTGCGGAGVSGSNPVSAFSEPTESSFPGVPSGEIILGPQSSLTPSAADMRALLAGHKLVQTGFSLVRIDVPNKAEISRLEQEGFDIWAIGPGFVVGLASDDLYGRLQLRPYRVDLISPKQGLSPQAKFDPAYHTYDEMVRDLQSIAAKYPKLTELVNIGKSWETSLGLANRNLWAIHITGTGDGSKKPGVVIFGAHHARELVTVELPMLLIAHLLENYGKNADITNLVDSRDIWIVPMVNPDGHFHAEKGDSWRKNTDDAADNNQFIGQLGTGVDLNRNYGYQWGANGGSSTNPNSEVYRGAAPFSEPETQAVRDFMLGHPNLKVMHSYHSFSNLVLWPWGYTEDPSPDAGTYQTIGKKLASYNGYTPEQGSQLYVASGITDDWTYGQLKALSFTTEVGGWGDGFDPPYSRVAKFWKENLPTDLYLLKIADRPLQAFGPEVVSIGKNHAAGSLEAAIFIQISNTHNGGSLVTGAEYFLDRIGADGQGTSISGVFGQVELQVKASIPHSAGRHMLLVHARDAEGDWGPYTAAYL